MLYMYHLYSRLFRASTALPGLIRVNRCKGRLFGCLNTFLNFTWKPVLCEDGMLLTPENILSAVFSEDGVRGWRPAHDVKTYFTRETCWHDHTRCIYLYRSGENRHSEYKVDEWTSNLRKVVRKYKSEEWTRPTLPNCAHFPVNTPFRNVHSTEQGWNCSWTIFILFILVVVEVVVFRDIFANNKPAVRRYPELHHRARHRPEGSGSRCSWKFKRTKSPAK